MSVEHPTHTGRVTTANHLFSVVSWGAVLVGVGLIVGGVGHLFGVVATALEQEHPYDSRMVSLLATAGLLLYAGALNIVVSRSIRRARRWALAIAAFTTVSLVAYLALLLPLPDAGGRTLGYLAVNVVYLGALGSAFLVRERR